MKPYSFDYLRATSISQVLELLEEYNGEARILAGGQSLITTLNMRLSAPEILIDINDLEEIQGIELVDARLRIGAMTRHADVLESDLVAEHVPLLMSAINHVAHAAIRNRGTHGGSIAFADPAAEIPACAVALDAQFIIQNSRGERRVAARDFFHDLYETDLQENEILTAVEYPLCTSGSVCYFREFARRKGDFATVGLAVNGKRRGAKISELAPVFFGVANVPVLTTDTSARVIDQKITPSVVESAMESLNQELDVIGDMYASTEMKMHLARCFLQEAIENLGGPQ